MCQVPAACNMAVTKTKNDRNNVDNLQKVENDSDLALKQRIITYDVEKVRYWSLYKTSCELEMRNFEQEGRSSSS